MSSKRPVLAALTAGWWLTTALTVGASTSSQPQPPTVASGIITTTVTDPDDIDGRLDIASVRHRIQPVDGQRVRLTYRVTTYDEFDASRLNPRHRHFIIELNRDAERGAERGIRISHLDGEGVVAEVISNATREVISTAHVTRVEANAIRIRGPRQLIGARSYFWYSNFHDRRSRRCGDAGGYPVTCQDSVPEQGWLRLDTPAWPRTAAD